MKKKSLSSMLATCLVVFLFSACSGLAPATDAELPTPSPTMTATPAPPPFRVVAYATTGVIEGLIPYEKLTHINYSFLIPNSDGTFNQIPNGWKLEQIVQNGHKKNVKVLVSVGGWGWDAEFETVAADPELRRQFALNLSSFVDEFQLDGADIDWEYPDPGQSSLNFLELIRELRSVMPDKLITSAVVAYGDGHGLGIPEESFALMDFVVVMTYSGADHGTMSQFNTGLSYWQERGLPQEKLVIGLPFYSEPGGIAYSKLVKHDPAAAQMDTYDYLGMVQNYNGIPTIQEKTRIALEKAGGVAFWTLDQDAQGEFSLVSVIDQTVHQP